MSKILQRQPLKSPYPRRLAVNPRAFIPRSNPTMQHRQPKPPPPPLIPLIHAIRPQALHQSTIQQPIIQIDTRHLLQGKLVVRRDEAAEKQTVDPTPDVQQRPELAVEPWQFVDFVEEVEDGCSPLQEERGVEGYPGGRGGGGVGVGLHRWGECRAAETGGEG